MSKPNLTLKLKVTSGWGLYALSDGRIALIHSNVLGFVRVSLSKETSALLKKRSFTFCLTHQGGEGRGGGEVSNQRSFWKKL